MTELLAADYPEMLPAPAALRGRLLAHYEWVGEWIAASFRRVPLVAIYYPHGLSGDEAASGAWHQALPSTVPPVQVRTPRGVFVYPACTDNALLWLVQKGAVGFGSWTPTADDAGALRYARILLRPNPGADDAKVREALRRVRTALQSFALDGIPLIEAHGAAIYVPFVDAPAYEPVRMFLRTVVARAASAAPATIARERKANEAPATGRVEVIVRSNAPGRYSSLPYTLVGPKLAMVTPIGWDEIDKARFDGDESAVGARLQRGDLFKALAAPLLKQRFSTIVDIAQ